MRVFFDSSALAKRHIEEKGTPEVLEWLERADEVLLCFLAYPEVISALSRLRHQGKLSPEDYQHRKLELASDVAHASVLGVTPAILQRAVEGMERFPLRASDAIHVATAIEFAAERFVSADDRQCKAAAGLGLRVERIALDK